MPHYKDFDFSAPGINIPDPEWAPRYWTPMLRDESLGDHIADFIETFVTPPRMTGTTWKLFPWQRWLLRQMFELKEDGTLRYRHFYFEIPRKNGKSFLASAVLLYFLAFAQDGDQLYCAASKEQQARFVFEEVLHNLRRSPFLKKLMTPMAKSVRHKLRTGAYLNLLTFAASHGSAPLLTVADELHNWAGRAGRAQKEALTTGSKDRKESLFLGISTAGEDLTGVGYEMHEEGVLAATSEDPDESFGFASWGVEDDEDIYEPATWRRCNPMLVEGIMREVDFVNELASAQVQGSGAFERYTLNRWLKHTQGESFINPVHLSNAYTDEITRIPPESPISVGFDGSRTGDSTAIVGIDLNTGFMEILWMKEKTDASDTLFFVSDEDVDEAMTRISLRYDVQHIYADPSHYHSLVLTWMRRWGKGVVRDIPQSVRRMAELGAELREDLYARKLLHHGDPKLMEHFTNAVENSYGMAKKESSKSLRKIDALIAAILANSGRREKLDKIERQAEYERQNGLA